MKIDREAEFANDSIEMIARRPTADSAPLPWVLSVEKNPPPE